MKNNSLKILAAELANLDFTVGRSLVAFPADEIEGLTFSGVIKKFETGKFSANILDGFKKKVVNERDSLVKEALEFYTSKLQFNDANSAMSPEEVYQLIESKIIRIKRLMMVFEPEFYPSVTKKANGEEYDMVKIFWINDSNKKYIKISKTYGLKGKAGLESSMKKLIRDYIVSDAEYSKDEFKLLQQSGRQIRTDLLVSIDGKEWIIEFKLINKDEFIKTAMRFELWDYYYQTYLKEPIGFQKIEL